MLNEAVKLYEQRHVLIKYLNLKIKLESITKSYSEVEKLCDDELLEYVINNIGISNTNNIYAYMGTNPQWGIIIHLVIQ